MKMNNISAHISYDEATLSPTAMRLKIDNTPNEAQYTAMIMVANQCFEPARKAMGKPIKINSFFRCEKLNKAVKGAKNSHHVLGSAIDMTMGSKEENEKLFEWCKANLKYTQLINEYDFSWIHISYIPDNLKQETLEIV